MKRANIKTAFIMLLLFATATVSGCYMDHASRSARSAPEPTGVVYEVEFTGICTAVYALHICEAKRKGGKATLYVVVEPQTLRQMAEAIGSTGRFTANVVLVEFSPNNNTARNSAVWVLMN